MAKQIRWSQPDAVLTGNDIVFHVSDHEGRLGQLQISKGGFVWFPVNAQKGKKVSWDKLIEFISENGRPTPEKKG